MAAAGKNHHGFTSYNKFSSQGALIGNYLEERCLEAATGFHRYPGWVDPGEAQETVYATHVGKALTNDTFPRVIQHTDRLEGSEWVSQTHDTYRGPNRTDLGVKNVSLPKMGKREQMALERLYQQAADLPQQEKLPHTHDTEHRTEFIPRDMTGLKIGARVMETQDRLAITVRDPTFLAEYQIQPRSQVDRHMPGSQMRTTMRPKAETEEGGDGVPYYKDLGISIYSDAVVTDKYTGSSTAYGTKLKGKVSPFTKNCDFSKPLSEYNKVVEDE